MAFIDFCGKCMSQCPSPEFDYRPRPIERFRGRTGCKTRSGRVFSQLFVRRVLFVEAFELVFLGPAARAAPTLREFLKGGSGRNFSLLVPSLGIIEIGAGSHGLALI